MHDAHRLSRDIQGRAFGIAAVTSTSRSIPPAISASRTQPNACH
jgi:hypothetical protein